MVIVNYASNRRCGTNWKRIKLNWTSIAKSWLATLPAAQRILDTMAHDYRQLYQHMAKSSSSLLPELSAEANPFRNRLAESEASNNQAPVQMPRDLGRRHPAVRRTDLSRLLILRAQPLRLLFSPSPTII
ncbi:ZapG family protein [Shigella flexneri]